MMVTDSSDYYDNLVRDCGELFIIIIIYLFIYLCFDWDMTSILGCHLYNDVQIVYRYASCLHVYNWSPILTLEVIYIKCNYPYP